LSAKPEQGFYDLEFRATADSYAPISSTIHSLKIISVAAVENVKVVVSDGVDESEIAAGKKYNIEYPKTESSTIKFEHFQHIVVNFRVKNTLSGKYIQPHQTFVTILNDNADYIVPATHDGQEYVAVFHGDDLTHTFNGKSGEYSLYLTVGDSFLSNSIHWKLATVSLKLSNETHPTSQHLFEAKPEIKHQFRVPEDRPSKSTSFIFTIAVLTPFLIFFFGLIRVGANLSDFPMGGGFIWAIGFQVCLGAILGLFALYWLRLNMMQTLSYLGVLAVPTIFFAQKSLNSLASKKVKTN